MSSFVQKYSSPLKVLAALTVVLLAYTVWWFSAAGAIKNQAITWAEERRAKGEGVGFQSLVVTGYPFWLNLDIQGPSLATPNGGEPLVWKTDRVTARARPWDFSTVEVFAPGRHTLGRVRGDGRETWTADVQSFHATLGLQGQRLRSIHVNLASLSLAPVEGKGEPVNLDQADITLTDHRTPDMIGEDKAYTLDGTLKGLILPSMVQWPLGNRLRSLSFKGYLKGDIVGSLTPDNLVPWRDGGGTVEVERLLLDYGPVVAQGEGTWALDKALQPIGAMTMRLRGLFEAVDILRKKGLIDGQAALTARVVLGVMAKKADDGGKPVLNVSLNVQDQELYIGPVKVARLPSIWW